MNNLRQAIWVETLKVRRSKMPLLTALAMALLPLGGGFFMIVLRDPEMARQAGLISAKAQITMGVADWPAYLNFLSVAMAAGTVFFSFIASWVFGREFADRTAKDLLALPTPRSSIVAAKLLVVILWSAALAVWVYLVGLAVGTAIGLPEPPPGAMAGGSATFVIAALLTIALLPPIAYFASVGHGYLPPMAVSPAGHGVRPGLCHRRVGRVLSVGRPRPLCAGNGDGLGQLRHRAPDRRRGDRRDAVVVGPGRPRQVIGVDAARSSSPRSSAPAGVGPPHFDFPTCTIRRNVVYSPHLNSAFSLKWVPPTFLVA